MLRVKKLCFSYDNCNNILDNISFTVNTGDYMSIIGSNGSSKSTLLKLTLGILKKTLGDIVLFDQKIEEFNQWSRIGYISQYVQNFNLKFPATVEEIVGANLYSSKRVIKFLNKEDKEKIIEVLKIVGMEEFKKKLIGTLSGGQQQRVFIARLLISNPEIIFMDEPFTGIDHNSQKRIYNVIEKLNLEKNVTIVMVTHDIKKAFEISDKVLLLKNRKIKEIDLTKITKEERYKLAIENMSKLE